jgi:hypothetical protein
MTRAAAVALILAVAGCKRVSPPIATDTKPVTRAPVEKTTPPKTVPSSSPTSRAVAASQPASVPASVPASAPSSAPAGLAALAPKLEQVVRALRAHRKGQLFKLKDELAKHIPGFATGDGKDLAEEASVEVLEVRGSSLVMAFVRVTPKGHKPCTEGEPSQEVYALSIRKADDGTESLGFTTSDFSASETKLFDSKRPARVVFPADAAPLPVVEVHYDYDPSCAEAGTATGKMVEVYHLASAERMGDAVSLDTSGDVPGKEDKLESKLVWAKKKTPDTALLAVTQVSTTVIHPCTGEPDDRSAGCRPQVECERTTRVIAVTRTGFKAQEQTLTELRRREPSLAKLPPDRTGKTEAACKRLSQF